MMNETVLDMHYHKPLMDLLRSVFGLGVGGLHFYKYSQQRESFIGFDQAYAKTDLSEQDFFRMLREAATSANYTLADKFLAYFLQFKVVKEMQNLTRSTPASIRNRPHYRVGLYTTRTINVGLSQHELLYRLSTNQGAMVYYACPMLFDRASLYDVEVDLDELRLADLTSCPSSYPDNETHFIYWNDKQHRPCGVVSLWKGRLLRRETWLRRSPRELASFILRIRRASCCDC